MSTQGSTTRRASSDRLTRVTAPEEDPLTTVILTCIVAALALGGVVVLARRGRR